MRSPLCCPTSRPKTVPSWSSSMRWTIASVTSESQATACLTLLLKRYTHTQTHTPLLSLSFYVSLSVSMVLLFNIFFTCFLILTQIFLKVAEDSGVDTEIISGTVSVCVGVCVYVLGLNDLGKEPNCDFCPPILQLRFNMRFFPPIKHNE